MERAGAGQMARDWITIRQSELSAAATDRERAQAWSGLVGAWAELARSMSAAARPPGHADDPARPATTAAPARTAPASDAPGAVRHEIERLAQRVAELERHLAARV